MILHKLLREQVLDERSFEERLRSLEHNNFILQQRIQTLEGENERLAATIRDKNEEDSHAGKLQVKKVNDQLQRNSIFEKKEALECSMQGENFSF